ncbi:hypothetical protein COLO4_19432 [Corchorus olitorius]|uniref:Reverse transcriptase zinc-binding domain-containing protein n=1 Tax=Corchorus olitorius TaxID=93759 RepID=A0A1R3J5E5_9ROSI|nr:hypothetical protein COLO4_19432 [Corchorus olitorius]
MEDKIIWNYSDVGMYSVKSGYFVARKLLGRDNPLIDTRPPIWRMIWQAEVQPKVKFFIWRLVWGIIPGKQILKNRGIDIEINCDVYNGVENSLLHTFFHCPFSQMVWRLCCPWLLQFVANWQGTSLWPDIFSKACNLHRLSKIIHPSPVLRTRLPTQWSPPSGINVKGMSSRDEELDPTTLKVINFGRDSITLPKFLALPPLKSLHLDRFSMTKMCFKPGDFSTCPNLETLKLTNINFGEDKTLCINAPKLKRLELSVYGYLNRGHDFKVVIDAPELKTLRYHANHTVLCSFGDLAFIDDVYFSMYNRYPWGYDEDEEEDEWFDMPFDQYREYVLHCINTFKKFRHAKSLTLPWDTVRALSLFPSLLDENRLPFPNLKRLKIDGQSDIDDVDIPGCVLNFFLNSFTMLKLTVLM